MEFLSNLVVPLLVAVVLIGVVGAVLVTRAWPRAAQLSPEERDEGLRRLAEDIESGAWEDRHRNLLDLDELDLGYRLIVA